MFAAFWLKFFDDAKILSDFVVCVGGALEKISVENCGLPSRASFGITVDTWNRFDEVDAFVVARVCDENPEKPPKTLFALLAVVGTLKILSVFWFETKLFPPPNILGVATLVGALATIFPLVVGSGITVFGGNLGFGLIDCRDGGKAVGTLNTFSSSALENGTCGDFMRASIFACGRK